MNIPEDFCFQLNSPEFNDLRFQNATSNHGGRRYLPHVYTEHGIIALAGVLKSEIADKMSVEIARKFIQMRKFSMLPFLSSFYKMSLELVLT